MSALLRKFMTHSGSDHVFCASWLEENPFFPWTMLTKVSISSRKFVAQWGEKSSYIKGNWKWKFFLVYNWNSNGVFWKFFHFQILILEQAEFFQKYM